MFGSGGGTRKLQGGRFRRLHKDEDYGRDRKVPFRVIAAISQALRAEYDRGWL